MRRAIAVGAACVVLSTLATSTAQVSGAALRERHELLAACRDDGGRAANELHEVTLGGTFTFDRSEDEAGQISYAVPARRRLRAMGGSVELLLSGHDRIAFIAQRGAGSERLDVARSQPARLRIGFFLGFDDPRRQPCVLRPRQAVSVLRVDLAYIEWLLPDGTVVAREDTDRLRAWHDDAERQATVTSGFESIEASPSPPAAWTDSLRAAGASVFAECASHDARIVVEWAIDPRGGATTPTVELADPPEAAACVRDAIAATRWPAPPRRTMVRASVRLRGHGAPPGTE